MLESWSGPGWSCHLSAKSLSSWADGTWSSAAGCSGRDGAAAYADEANWRPSVTFYYLKSQSLFTVTEEATNTSPTFTFID